MGVNGMIVALCVSLVGYLIKSLVLENSNPFDWGHNNRFDHLQKCFLNRRSDKLPTTYVCATFYSYLSLLAIEIEFDGGRREQKL